MDMNELRRQLAPMGHVQQMDLLAKLGRTTDVKVVQDELAFGTWTEAIWAVQLAQHSRNHSLLRSLCRHESADVVRRAQTALLRTKGGDVLRPLLLSEAPAIERRRLVQVLSRKGHRLVAKACVDDEVLKHVLAHNGCSAAARLLNQSCRDETQLRLWWGALGANCHHAQSLCARFPRLMLQLLAADSMKAELSRSQVRDIATAASADPDAALQLLVGAKSLVNSVVVATAPTLLRRCPLRTCQALLDAAADAENLTAPWACVGDRLVRSTSLRWMAALSSAAKVEKLGSEMQHTLRDAVAALLLAQRSVVLTRGASEALQAWLGKGRPPLPFTEQQLVSMFRTAQGVELTAVVRCLRQKSWHSAELIAAGLTLATPPLDSSLLYDSEGPMLIIQLQRWKLLQPLSRCAGAQVLPEYVEWLPYAEALPYLQQRCTGADAGARELGLRALVRCAVREGSESVCEALVFLESRLRNEQDDIRARVLATLADAPSQVWESNHMKVLARLLAFSLQAKGSSHASLLVWQRLAQSLLFKALVSETDMDDNPLSVFALQLLHGIHGQDAHAEIVAKEGVAYDLATRTVAEFNKRKEQATHPQQDQLCEERHHAWVQQSLGWVLKFGLQPLLTEFLDMQPRQTQRGAHLLVRWAPLCWRHAIVELDQVGKPTLEACEAAMHYSRILGAWKLDVALMQDVLSWPKHLGRGPMRIPVERWPALRHVYCRATEAMVTLLTTRFSMANLLALFPWTQKPYEFLAQIALGSLSSFETEQERTDWNTDVLVSALVEWLLNADDVQRLRVLTQLRCSMGLQVVNKYPAFLHAFRVVAVMPLKVDNNFLNDSYISIRSWAIECLLFADTDGNIASALTARLHTPCGGELLLTAPALLEKMHRHDPWALQPVLKPSDQSVVARLSRQLDSVWLPLMHPKRIAHSGYFVHWPLDLQISLARSWLLPRLSAPRSLAEANMTMKAAQLLLLLPGVDLTPLQQLLRHCCTVLSSGVVATSRSHDTGETTTIDTSTVVAAAERSLAGKVLDTCTQLLPSCARPTVGLGLLVEVVHTGLSKQAQRSLGKILRRVSPQVAQSTLEELSQRPLKVSSRVALVRFAADLGGPRAVELLQVLWNSGECHRDVGVAVLAQLVRLEGAEDITLVTLRNTIQQQKVEFRSDIDYMLRVFLGQLDMTRLSRHATDNLIPVVAMLCDLQPTLVLKSVCSWARSRQPTDWGTAEVAAASVASKCLLDFNSSGPRLHANEVLVCLGRASNSAVATEGVNVLRSVVEALIEEIVKVNASSELARMRLLGFINGTWQASAWRAAPAAASACAKLLIDAPPLSGLASIGCALWAHGLLWRGGTHIVVAHIQQLPPCALDLSAILLAVCSASLAFAGLDKTSDELLKMIVTESLLLPSANVGAVAVAAAATTFAAVQLGAKWEGWCGVALQEVRKRPHPALQLALADFAAILPVDEGTASLPITSSQASLHDNNDDDVDDDGDDNEEL